MVVASVLHWETRTECFTSHVLLIARNTNQGTASDDQVTASTNHILGGTDQSLSAIAASL